MAEHNEIVRVRVKGEGGRFTWVERGASWAWTRMHFASRFPHLSSSDLDTYADVRILRACEHKQWQTYTRYPCECGRSLWPPRGRGRGEAVTSERRAHAQGKAMQAWELRELRDMTWAEIATALDYGSPASAWKAVRRLLDRSGQKGRPMPHRVGPLARATARDMRRFARYEHLT